MASAVGWLDASAADERRIREIVRLFSVQDSRDELGVGQIRDALSELLFPATSVIQTRARYFLIVPWLIAYSSQRRRAGRTILQDVEIRERALISHFLEQGHLDGLIGRLAGPKVHILPSTIYWSGLISLGVLPAGMNGPGLHDWLDSRPSVAAARRALAEVPAPPDDFPAACDGGFELTQAEASWLRDRIAIGSTGSTVFAHLATGDTPPSDARYAWDDPGVAGASVANQALLRHAEHFSLLAQGAALLYNLMLAEQANRAGFDLDLVESYDEEIGRWSTEVDDHRSRLDDWDLDDFWSTVILENPRVSALTRFFVNEWIETVRRSSDVATAVRSSSARELVMQREIRQKRTQSRFRNEKLLGIWTGAAGTGRLDFRWGTARRHLTDIHTGLGHVAP